MLVPLYLSHLLPANTPHTPTTAVTIAERAMHFASWTQARCTVESTSTLFAFPDTHTAHPLQTGVLHV